MKLLAPCFFLLVSLLTAPNAAFAQKKYSLVGNWRADVVEFGESSSIYWNVFADGTSAYRFVWNGGQTAWLDGSWAYPEDIVYECWSDGECGYGHVQWLSRDCFVLTILRNQLSPQMDGWKRLYRRVQYP